MTHIFERTEEELAAHKAAQRDFCERLLALPLDDPKRPARIRRCGGEEQFAELCRKCGL